MIYVVMILEVSNPNRLLCFGVLFVATITLLTASIQDVLAMPGPLEVVGFEKVAQGAFNTYTLTGDITEAGGAAFLPTEGSIYVIAHSTAPSTTIGVPAPGALPCVAIRLLGTGTVWVLTHADGTTKATYSLDDGESITVTFTDGTAVAGVALGPGAAITGAGHKWVAIASPIVIPQLQTIGGNWQFFTCGVDGFGNVGGASNFVASEFFEVVVPVAGKVIPIDTTALLIAGFSSNPFWILTMLAITAGASFTLLRFQLLRK